MFFFKKYLHNVIYHLLCFITISLRKVIRKQSLFPIIQNDNLVDNFVDTLPLVEMLLVVCSFVVLSVSIFRGLNPFNIINLI